MVTHLGIDDLVATKHVARSGTLVRIVGDPRGAPPPQLGRRGRLLLDPRVSVRTGILVVPDTADARRSNPPEPEPSLQRRSIASVRDARR